MLPPALHVWAGGDGGGVIRLGILPPLAPPKQHAYTSFGRRGPVDGRMGGAVRGGGVGGFRAFPRPHPARGPGARRGRMGPEVGPAFQRRSRDTPSSNLGVRFGGNGGQARGFKRKAYFLAFWS
eukprot:gene9947-biopygen204